MKCHPSARKSLLVPGSVRMFPPLIWCAILVAPAFAGHTESPARVVVDTAKPVHRVSRLLTGACIEDVNHEIYGGLYSQMLFGEGFQEPPPTVSPQGFRAVEGEWNNEGQDLLGPGGSGPKLLCEMEPVFDGEAGVELLFDDASNGNAGLIMRVSNARAGADAFDGYEISLDCAAQVLRLGRHRQNWELLSDTPYPIPTGQWITLRATLTGASLDVYINGNLAVSHTDSGAVPGPGVTGLRQWQRNARYRNFWYGTQGRTIQVPFTSASKTSDTISGMWRLTQSGTATGACRLVQEEAFTGTQSQRLEFHAGEGTWGIENQGLNGWGLCFKEGASYEGCLWVKTAESAEMRVALQSADGSVTHGEQRIEVASGGWKRYDVELASDAPEENGRFEIALTKPGTLDVGYAFLQPGPWGRFKGLPVRRDVAEALVDQGVTLLRYGGSMVNSPQYRWKNMIGSPDRRPPYRGTWYPFSTNGWGIIDFMNFCEAAGFEYVPAFNAAETPQDMADFVEYAKGGTNTAWGRKRAEDGHPEPYSLHYVQIGNEEFVDDAYAARFADIAQAVWPMDPELVLVVGDFVYRDPIVDPSHITGHLSGLPSLEGQRQILDLARRNNREVWFDLHVGTDGPKPDTTFTSMFTFVDALERLVPEAPFKVAVFEFNSGNHTHRRGLANALAINAIQRDGRIPVAASANCLQPDGQNDNGWDQGLLFLNPCKVWLQSPGYVTRMVSGHYQPLSLRTEVEGTNELDVAASRSEDGLRLVIQAVNSAAEPMETCLVLREVGWTAGNATVETLSGQLDAVNTQDHPGKVAPVTVNERFKLKNGEMRHTFPPHSFTVIEFLGNT